MNDISTAESASDPIVPDEVSMETVLSSTSATSTDGKPDLSGYGLGDFIAEGGFAKVYNFVTTPAGGRQLVAKVMEDAREAAVETRVLSLVKHRNIIELLDVIPDGDNVQLILPKMDATLTDAFRNVKLPLNQVSYVIREVLNGLIALKSNKFVYADLKSANILIDSSGNVKLSDFGLATKPTRRMIIATISWMPPEAFINATIKKTKRRHKQAYEFDVWGVGLLLLDARLTGSLHRMKRHDPGIVASKLPQTENFVQPLRNDWIAYEAALRDLPEDAVKFLQATLAPPNLRLSAEQLLIDPFIRDRADNGREGWKACAPLIVANVEIRRIKKKYDVKHNRAVASTHGAEFVFEKPAFPDDDAGRAGAGRDPLAFNDRNGILSGPEPDDNGLMRRLRLRSFLGRRPDPCAVGDIDDEKNDVGYDMRMLFEPEEAAHEQDVVTGVEPEESDDDVVTAVEPDDLDVTGRMLDLEEFMVKTDAGYSCVFCPHTTTGRCRKQNMKTHVKTHLGIKSYVCRNDPQCGYKGSDFRAWKDHEARLCHFRR